VLLQDRAQHIGEVVDGCWRSLTTMYSVTLPCNPLPGSFPRLLDAFRSSQRIHRLIELNLVAGANFALGWTRKWHPRLNYSSMSLSMPPGGARLQVHMDATLQPARRLIARLLREDSAFFREHHYLDPLGVDDFDQPQQWCLYAFLCVERESFCFWNLSEALFYSQGVFTFPLLVRVSQFCLKTCKLKQEELCLYLYL
jgi:hypothetical protein